LAVPEKRVGCFTGAKGKKERIIPLSVKLRKKAEEGKKGDHPGISRERRCGSHCVGKKNTASSTAAVCTGRKNKGWNPKT